MIEQLHSTQAGFKDFNEDLDRDEGSIGRDE